MELDKKIIIANNCLDGYLHRFLYDEEYFTPFVWGGPTEDDFVKFCKDYDTIDFSDYKIIEWEDTKFYQRRKSYVFGKEFEEMNPTSAIEFSNGVQFIFPHFAKGDVRKKYETRLARFYERKYKEPIFVFYWRKCSLEDIRDFYELDIRYFKILIVEHEEYLGMFPSKEGTLVLHDKNIFWLKDIGRYVAQEIVKSKH